MMESLNLEHVGSLREHCEQLRDHFEEAAVLIEQSHIDKAEILQLKHHCEIMSSLLVRVLLQGVTPQRQAFLRREVNDAAIAITGPNRGTPLAKPFIPEAMTQADGFAD